MKHCATSLRELAAGQRVNVVAGLGDLLPGVVVDVTGNYAEVAYDRGGRGVHRPYEIQVTGAPDQLELPMPPLCVLPGCNKAVADHGDVCPGCRAAFGEMLQPGERLTPDQISQRDNQVRAAYARQRTA